MNEGCHSTVAQSCWSFLSRAFTSLVFWQSDFNPTFLSFWADYSISSFLDCYFASSLLCGIATASLRWTALCCTDALSQLNANQLWRRHSLEMAGMDPCLSCPSPCAWYHGGCSRMGPTDMAGLAGSLRAHVYGQLCGWLREVQLLLLMTMDLTVLLPAHPGPAWAYRLLDRLSTFFP